MNDGRCSVRLTRRYADAPKEVWRALTEEEALARWLAPGFAVERTELEPGRLLELDWRPPGERPSLVRIELTPDAKGTILVLEHSRIEERLGMRYTARWLGTLERIPLTEQP